MEKVWREKFTEEELGDRFFGHLRKIQEAKASKNNKYWYVGTAVSLVIIVGILCYTDPILYYRFTSWFLN